MRSAITDVGPAACANREMASVVGNEVQFDTAVLRLKRHLSGWGAPFADIEDETVREIAVILRALASGNRFEYMIITDDTIEAAQIRRPWGLPPTEEQRKARAGDEPAPP